MKTLLSTRKDNNNLLLIYLHAKNYYVMSKSVYRYHFLLMKLQ